MRGRFGIPLSQVGVNHSSTSRRRGACFPTTGATPGRVEESGEFIRDRDGWAISRERRRLKHKENDPGNGHWVPLETFPRLRGSGALRRTSRSYPAEVADATSAGGFAAPAMRPVETRRGNKRVWRSPVPCNRTNLAASAAVTRRSAVRWCPTGWCSWRHWSPWCPANRERFSSQNNQHLPRGGSPGTAAFR